MCAVRSHCVIVLMALVLENSVIPIAGSMENELVDSIKSNIK